MGRQDCLGATMVLRRDTLDRIGGFQALVDHLADDKVLGRLVAALGLAVRLAATVPATTVPGGPPARPVAPRAALGAHHPRPGAGRVRRLGAAISAGLGAAGGAAVGRRRLVLGVFFIAWVGRALAAPGWTARWSRSLCPRRTPGVRPALGPRFRAGGGTGEAPAPDDLRLEDGMNLEAAAAPGLAFPCPVWLLPLRDLISVGVMLASYAGRQVEWRGHRLTADTPGRAAPGLTTSKGLRPR